MRLAERKLLFTSENKILLFILFIFSISILNSQISNLFSQQPTQEWVQRYSGNGYANGLSVKLDSLGYVYVLTRASIADSTSSDYCVVKYSNAGSFIWSTFYNSPGNLGDVPVAFGVTGAGDIYITGSSGANFTNQILTVKFNSGGILQWAKTANVSYGGEDLNIDKQGNIVIVGNGATIVKYNPNGDTLWMRAIVYGVNGTVFNRVVTDDSCNVYATGFCKPDAQHSYFMTVKYNSSGTLMWYSTYYSDPDYRVDLAYCIAIDANRNVYVAGLSWTLFAGNRDNSLLKIDPNGTIQWARVYKGIGENNQVSQPAAIAVTPDGSGIFYTTFCGNGTGGGGYDIVTLKYNTFGDSLWVRSYGGGVGGTQNAPVALKLDRSGNCYITGNVYSSPSGNDYITIKYLTNGVPQWFATYNGPLSNSFDYAHDLIIDTNLSVFVTGISSWQNNPLRWDEATIKYNQPIGIISNNYQLPAKFILEQNFPNPFNSVTIINYEIPVRGNVELKVCNVMGQAVKTLVSNEQAAGYYSVVFNAESFASGVYFYQLTVSSEQSTVYSQTKKIVLIK